MDLERGIVLHGYMDIAEMPFQRISSINRVGTRRMERQIDRPNPSYSPHLPDLHLTRQ